MTNLEPKREYKILMLAPTMFFADYGCHVRIFEEASILQKLGHRVTILSYPNGRDLDGIDVRRCWGVPFNYRIEVGSSRHKIYLDFMLAIMALWHTIRNRPDIIHAHLHEGALLGWFLSKLTGVPLIFDFQGSLTGEMLDHHFIREESPFFKPLAWLEKQIDHMARVVLTSSTHAAMLLHEQYQVPTGKIHPTPDCVNADTFNPSRYSAAEKTALKQALDIPPNKQLIVYSGLLTEYQGVGLLLHALRHLNTNRQDFHLLLMGFPAIAYYQDLARNLGIAHLVTFTGKMPYEHLAAHLALGNIAVAPKLSATEGNGKILNYISMALPTIAFKTPVSQEYLRHLGVYADERTAESLAEAINTALDMSPRRQKELGQTLRKWVIDTYNWEQSGREIEAVYHAVRNGHPQPATEAKRISALNSHI